MKIDRRIYKGIEYVQFNDLPASQKEKLLESVGREFFIKILIDGQVVAQCIQYSDYSMWYHKTYAPGKGAPVKESSLPLQENVVIPTDLALNKI